MWVNFPYRRYRLECVLLLTLVKKKKSSTYWATEIPSIRRTRGTGDLVAGGGKGICLVVLLKIVRLYDFKHNRFDFYVG